MDFNQIGLMKGQQLKNVLLPWKHTCKILPTFLFLEQILSSSLNVFHLPDWFDCIKQFSNFCSFPKSTFNFWTTMLVVESEEIQILILHDFQIDNINQFFTHYQVFFWKIRHMLIIIFLFHYTTHTRCPKQIYSGNKNDE